MKRTVAILLTLLMLLSLIPAGAAAQTETVEKKGFYTVNWSDVDPEWGFDYVYYMPFFYAGGTAKDATEARISVNYYNSSDMATISERMKEDMNARPQGARFINLSALPDLFRKFPEAVIYMDKPAGMLERWMDAFLADYRAIGGKLDGISVDLEYHHAYTYYLETEQYNGGNRMIYRQIVEHPAYEKRLRSKLVTHGFTFYPEDKQTEEKSEIFTICRDSGSNYSKDRTIFDNVIKELMSEYIQECVVDPLLKYYPQGTVSDYQRIDTKAWLKHIGDSGSISDVNQVKVGNVSNFNMTYAARPGSGFYSYSNDRRGSYKKPPSFNEAVFEPKPFNMMLWDVNLLKRAQAATDNGLIDACLTFFNYGPNVRGTLSNTPYYSEAILHVGLLDPVEFIGYIIPDEVLNKGMNDRDLNVADYDYSLRVVNDLMAELTRVAGYADRKTLAVPESWSKGYLLSGMYANGRNIWRITPDTTKVSVADFKVAGEDPTFSVDGLTVTFPGGKIIEDSKITKVGTCGYWVETPANVNPIVTAAPDRYARYPSFQETFETRTVGGFSDGSVYPDTYWQVAGIPKIVENGGNKALSLTGDVTLTNAKVPENITAGDEYAKQQVWEVKVTLPDGDYGGLRLFRCKDDDGGFKVQNGKVSYDKAGEYVELCDLPAGTYTFKREVDFRTEGAYLSSFYIYDASGNLLSEAKDVPMVDFAAPVSTITMKAIGVKNAVLLDDYKLYPVGVTTFLELFDVAYGTELEDITAQRTEDTAYRLSWMNASDTRKTARIVETKSGNVLETIVMEPGMDGVSTGVVAANGKTIQIAVELVQEETPADPPAADTPAPKSGISNNTLILIIILLTVVLCGSCALVIVVKKRKPHTEKEESL